MTPIGRIPSRTVAILIIAITSAAAQSPSAFEVVSVKRASALEHGGGSSGLQPGGRFVMTNGPVRVLLNMAYRTPTNELIGAPDWVTYENWDVEARAGRDLQFDELAPLLRHLLADRFKLRAHLETRGRPAYELRMVRADRQLGPAMRPSKMDCESLRGACSTRGELGEGLIESNGISMVRFATWLPARVGRPVFDKTGLDGDYELVLRFATLADATDAPSLPTALREQLGLTLEPVDLPTEVLVIDHIERPTAN
jgi:uncharacterized protein (TIGR03435 family)